MKKGLVVIIAFLLVTAGFSQDLKFKYDGRMNPPVKKENLNFVRHINQISPDLFKIFTLPYQDHELLHRLLAMQSIFFVEESRIKNYTIENYTKIIDYVNVEVFATCNGERKRAKGYGGILSTEQKSLLNTADLGSDVRLNIQFKFKNKSTFNIDSERMIEGDCFFTIVPDKEAEFPGGFERLSEYYQKNVYDKTKKEDGPRLPYCIVQFTVNEEGKPENVHLTRSTESKELDKLIIEVTQQMPAWKPAVNSKGILVKQVFEIPFGGGGC